MVDSRKAIEEKVWDEPVSNEGEGGSAVSLVSGSDGEQVPLNQPGKDDGAPEQAPDSNIKNHLESVTLQEPTVSQTGKVSGRVKWFNWNKGFGFITVDGSDEEVFVHQSNIDSDGFRSLYENESVEFDLVVGEDGKKKAFHVTGPDGQPPRGAHNQTQQRPPTYKMGAYGMTVEQSMGMAPPPMGGSFPQLARTPPGQSQLGYYGQIPAEAYYAPAYYSMPGSGYSPPYPQQMMSPGGRGYYPGGRNWVGARPPPPGTPGFSSGLQVVVHNLPWDCTWQELRAAFTDIGPIERADVVFDSHGRSRGFGIVRFPDRESAELAVERMNNKAIGGRIVSVRVDRFA